MHFQQYLVIIALSVLMVAGCTRKRDTGGPPDAWKSPYVEPRDVAPAAPPEAVAPEPPKPKVHPASLERPYKMYSVEELGTSDGAKALLALLADPKQGAAALEEVKKGGPAMRELVRKALACSRREIRIQAALVLGSLKDTGKETVAALCDAVLLDPDPDVRAMAAKAFVSIKAPGAVSALIRSLKEDPFEEARANAAWALGNIGSPGAIEPLRAALQDEDTWVRLRATSALKKMKAKAAVPDLIERLGDKSPMVRERAREALKDITGKDLGPDPDAWRRR